MVTFSKKAQTAGYYFGDLALRPNKPYRQFNTWMGDPARAVLFRGIIDEVEKFGLGEKTARLGEYLFGKLEGLAQKYPGEFGNLRARGWARSLRLITRGGGDEFLLRAKKVGVNIGGSGQSAVRLRPMLVFEEKHAGFVGRRALEKVVKSW